MLNKFNIFYTLLILLIAIILVRNLTSAHPLQYPQQQFQYQPQQQYQNYYQQIPQRNASNNFQTNQYSYNAAPPSAQSAQFYGGYAGNSQSSLPNIPGASHQMNQMYQNQQHQQQQLSQYNSNQTNLMYGGATVPQNYAPTNVNTNEQQSRAHTYNTDTMLIFDPKCARRDFRGHCVRRHFE